MKECKKCSRVLEEALFNKNKAKKDGLSTQCKDCNKLNLKAHYASNKHYYYVKNNLRKKELSLIIDTIKECTPCADCGMFNTAESMDYDHIVGTKLDNVSSMVRNMCSLAKIADEIDKCELVCAVCHRVRTRKRMFAQ